MMLLNKIRNLDFWLVCAIVFVTPLLFVPPLVDAFDLPKGFFLLVASLLVLTFWLLKSVMDKKLVITKSPFLLPALLFVGASIVSALLTDNKYIAIASDPVSYFGGVLLFILISQLVTKEKPLLILIKALLFAGFLMSILVVVQNVVTLTKVATTIPYLSLGFSSTGSALSQAIFLAIILPVGVGVYLQKKGILNLVLVAGVAVGLTATVYVLFRQNPILLPVAAGWRIATGTLGQSLVSAFFGTGPSNFVDAFTVFKPLDFNTSRLWSLRFTTSSNFYFTLLTTVGIAGLASFLLLAVRVVKMAKKRFDTHVMGNLEKGLLGSLVLALALFALLPTSMISLTAFFVVLGLTVGYFAMSENSAFTENLPDITTNNIFLRPVALVLSLILLGFVAFNLGKFVLADYYFAKSLVAAQNNQGTQTYNLQITATTLNPYNDSYRVSYSQTNLALADALAGQQNLTDEQKQTVVALVQQAIRESRLAAGLAPKRAGNYENLSLIYRALLNFAQGADQWSVVSENQAINLDPVNPRLRLDLGSIYFSQKNYQTAGQMFLAAVNLKSDYANAHYNLAQAMKQLGLKDQATTELQTTATLVCTSTPNADCDRVNAEIKDLGATPETAPSAVVPQKVATQSGVDTNLPKAKTTPPVKITTPSGELAQ